MVKGWKKQIISRDLEAAIADALVGEFDRRTFLKDTYAEWLRNNDFDPMTRWTINKKQLSMGSMIISHIATQVTLVILEDNNGRKISFMEYNGYDRGPKREERLKTFFGAKGMQFLRS